MPHPARARLHQRLDHRLHATPHRSLFTIRLQSLLKLVTVVSFGLSHYQAVSFNSIDQPVLLIDSL